MATRSPPSITKVIIIGTFREEEESHDRDTRKALYIGESDDDSPDNRCRTRSLLNTVRKRSTKGLHEEQYSANTPRSGRYSTHVRQLSPRQKTGEVTSHLPKRQDEHNQTVTAYSSDREPRTFRRSRTPIRTGKKAKNSDLSPRTKRGVSPRSEITPARRSRTDSTEKTVKRGKHGNSHRQCPSTADIFPRRPDHSKSYLTHKHKKGSASSNYEEGTEESTDTDTMIESPPKGRERSPSPIKVRHRQSKSRDRGKKGSFPRHRHKDRRERKTTARRQREDTVDSDSTDSSSSSECDSERGRPEKVCHTKHILKPPKFDRVRSFESFWA